MLMPHPISDFYTLNALLNGVARSGLRPVSESRESHLWNASYLPPELASVFATPSFLALFPLVLGVGRVLVRILLFETSCSRCWCARREIPGVV